MTLEKADYPVRQIIDDVLSAVRVRAEQKGLALEVDYALSASRDHPNRPRPPASNPHQSAGERGQVHGARRGSHCRPLHARSGRLRVHAVRHFGHRHRHSRRPGRRTLSAFHAGGCLREPPLRRHGPGAGHLQTPGQGTWRRRGSRQPVGRGQHIHPDDRCRPAARACACRNRRRPLRLAAEQPSFDGTRGAPARPGALGGRRSRCLHRASSCPAEDEPGSGDCRGRLPGLRNGRKVASRGKTVSI